MTKLIKLENAKKYIENNEQIEIIDEDFKKLDEAENPIFQCTISLCLEFGDHNQYSCEEIYFEDDILKKKICEATKKILSDRKEFLNALNEEMEEEESIKKLLKL